MLLGQEVLGGCTAGRVRPLCCQNAVPSPVGSGWPEEMGMLGAVGLWLPLVCCRERGEAAKDGSKCPCGLWVLVAQPWGVLCLLEHWWGPSSWG